MRTIFMGLMAALLVASRVVWAQPPPAKPPVQAQQPATDRPAASGVSGLVDVGLRGSDIAGDGARFQRYRDLGDGPFLEVFRYNRESDRWLFDAGAEHVGRRDQRYLAAFERFGKVKASFLWDQIPLFISQDTRTLFRVEAPGVLRIDNAIQQAIEGGRATIRDFVDQATQFKTRNRRDIAAFDFVLIPREDVDVKVRFNTARREGTMPYGASFGFNHAVEVALPLDQRTTSLSAGAEWGNTRGMFRLGYDGSWFNNDIQTLVWDNPLKFTDSTSATAYSTGLGTSQGRMALWPSNRMHTFSTAGSLRLPARSRVTAYVAFGAMRQNEPIVPHTINTAIPQLPLERATVEAEASTRSANVTFTSRPMPRFSIDARVRYYDFENNTPPFELSEKVRIDQLLVPAEGGPELFSSTRATFDVDVSFMPVRLSSLKVGFGRAQTDRTHRIFETTAENTFRVSFDAMGNQYVAFRTMYEHARREGDRFQLEELLAVGEQPGMRHFDIANRDRNRITAIATVTPMATLGISASIAAGRDDYDEGLFGLRDNDHRVYGFGFDMTPRDHIAFGVSYTNENYTAFQRSRNASPGVQFDDPRRDWSTDTDDTVHNVTGSFDLVRAFPHTDVRLGYNVSRAKSTYLYGLAPNSTLTPPTQLPPVTNELQAATLDVKYFLRENVSVGVAYWFDRYRVEDFALGPTTLTGIALPPVEPDRPIVPTTGILLDYLYRPYTAHTVWGRLTYYW